MPRKTLVSFLAILILLLASCQFDGGARAGMPFFNRKNSAPRGEGPFPGTGDVPDLELISKILTYKNESFQELYGSAGNRYIEYGMLKLMSADYTYGGKDRRVSLEIVTMETPIAAAGLFHYHRGKILNNQGEDVPVGAEGAVDKARQRRNLYFYRSNMFVKIVYSGDEPVPSLMPIATYVDSHLPAGRDEKPEGIAYLDIEGVNTQTTAITSGFTFNISFMPPAVWASAPGGGSPASDLFIITRNRDREAQEVFRDYTAYLRLYAKYYEEYEREGRKYTKGVDPSQGRVVFTCYRNVVIIAARPDGYEKGEALIDLVMEKIDEVKGGGKAAGGEKSGRRFGIFRRK